MNLFERYSKIEKNVLYFFKFGIIGKQIWGIILGVFKDYFDIYQKIRKKVENAPNSKRKK